MICALEHEWLQARDAATLERILASDFVHPVPSGVLLTRAQHIAWVVAHPRPESSKARFESLRVRFYGTTAIANGVVVAQAPGQAPRRTVFTDVFVYRDHRWQAVNAQENVVATQ
ncbi:MAG TPA: nuclear transport factor 2 family protein [Armatimonadota bacterium]|nr:nuclear transport factor 2 family protein [Armatimonadota bacterium]